MNRRFFMLLVTLPFTYLAYAQESGVFSYTSQTIHDSLKKDAHAVYRLDEALLDITSPSHYTEKVHQIITILDEEGADHLKQSFGFDRFYKVSDVSVKVYNKLGLEVGKYRKKDFDTRNYYDGLSLATDDKYMQLKMVSPGFPCTVELQYELEATGYINLPGWHINPESESTELFRYTVKVPADLDIRYRTVHWSKKPEVQTSGNIKTYVWESKNIPVRKTDEDGYDASDYSQRIEIGPNLFEYDGYKGAFHNWKEFGLWCYALYDEKKPFEEQRITEIKNLIATCTTQQEKIKVLYDYLKRNMRYVSIQFGIGGYKPFAVKFVDEKKYGDCKALTNYMRYLLSAAGIKSYPALINAGYNKPAIDPDFPQNKFNHVILCIPGQKDTTWLECTSKHSSCGFLGSFTENKNALLLTEEGGVLVRTPRSFYGNNKYHSHSDVVVDNDGGAIIKSEVYATGDIGDVFSQIKEMSNDHQKEAFVHYLKYKQPDEFSIHSLEDSAEGYMCRMSFTYDKLYDFYAGKKYFFSQGIHPVCEEQLNPSEIRGTDYLFEFPYEKMDTTVYHLPEGFVLDNPPAPIEMSNENAIYRRKIISNSTDRSITIVSQFILKNHIIASKKYNELARFLSEVKKDEEQKLVVKVE